jgi:hypothetical protein
VIHIREYGRDKTFTSKVDKIISNSDETIKACVQYFVFRTLCDQKIPFKEFETGNLSFIENEMSRKYLIEGNSLIFKLRRIHYIKRENKELLLIPKNEPKFITDLYKGINDNNKTYKWEEIGEPKQEIVVPSVAQLGQQNSSNEHKIRRTEHISKLEFAFGFRKILRISGFEQKKIDSTYIFTKDNVKVVFYVDSGKVEFDTN